MAGPPIKFRCYQCNQLMGVSRSKAGRVVSCPRCAAELVVPPPDEAPPPGGQSVSSDTAPAFLAALESGLPIEIADIRPEDIRAVRDDDGKPPASLVDPPRPAPASASASAFAPPPPPVSTLAPATVPESFAFPPPAEPAPARGGAARPDIASAVTPLVVSPAPAPSPLPGPAQGFTPAGATPGIETTVPPIKLEPTSLVPERTPTVRARDIVLPRSVVASWSLLVLLAQALAFVAGLLAGHYVWRLH